MIILNVKAVIVLECGLKEAKDFCDEERDRISSSFDSTVLVGKTQEIFNDWRNRIREEQMIQIIENKGW